MSITSGGNSEIIISVGCCDRCQWDSKSEESVRLTWHLQRKCDGYRGRSYLLCSGLLLVLNHSSRNARHGEMAERSKAPD